MASLLVFLAASPRVDAAPRPITGKLTKPGYTVIALAADGRATSVGLDAQLTQSVNANAMPATTAQADALLSSGGVLKIGFVRGDSAELDCGRAQSRADPSVGGLVYCSRGGTGRLLPSGNADPSTFPAFPDCCDPDGDGFGTLQPLHAKATMVLRHGATTAQIGTGDLLIERVTSGGVGTQLTTTVQYVFATVPALASYSDGQGNAATISYPVAGGAPGTTPGNGLSVTAGPNGDVIVTLTFWRPQRRPIAGEACLDSTPPCEWIDIGRLGYFALSAEGADWGYCPQNAFSSRDPNLIKGPYTGDEPLDPSIGGFTDLAPDRPANPANTFTYSVNLTRCLATKALSFNPGETRNFAFTGGTTGAASQTVLFTRR